MASPIISVDDAMAYLNVSDGTQAAEVSDFVDAASQAWVTRVGPVAGSPTYSEWHDGGGPMIVLRHTPVQSVTSVTEAYTATLAYTLNAEVLDGSMGGDAYGYTFDAETGVLVRRVTGMATSFAAGIRNVHVVYTAGYADIPADIVLAVKDILNDMWTSQRGGARRPGANGEPIVPRLWPRRAQEIADSYQVPGIA